MAETTTATSKPATPRTNRSRSTAAAKTTTTKAAPKVAPATEDGRIKIELEHAGDTANYARFNAPANLTGVVVGSIYAPLGTSRVLVAVIGADDTGE